MSSENLTPLDLPSFENAILVFLSDHTSKEGLITLAATESWEVKLLSEDIAVAMNTLSSSSSSSVPSLQLINSIPGAIAALPSKQITLTDPQQLLSSDIEQRFPDSKSIKSEINLQGQNTLSIIFANASSKLTSLREILQDEGLSQKLIRSSLIVEEDQTTQRESSFTTSPNGDDDPDQPDNSTNQVNYNKERTSNDDKSLFMSSNMDQIDQISDSQTDQSQKDNKSKIIASSSIQDESVELNRKRKNSELALENGNHEDKSSDAYSEPSLHKKLHRSSVSGTFKTFAKYLALAIILAGLILIISRNFSQQDFYNLTQFIQQNIPPDP